MPRRLTLIPPGGQAQRPFHPCLERKGQVALAPSLIQTKNTSAAIATYAIICASMYGLLAFSFYRLMQPARIPNLGLLTYKPPPATVIAYQAGALSVREIIYF